MVANWAEVRVSSRPAGPTHFCFQPVFCCLHFLLIYLHIEKELACLPLLSLHPLPHLLLILALYSSLETLILSLPCLLFLKIL